MKNTEGCGTVSTGYLTQYPADHSLAAYELSCIVNDTTCNFNKKTAFPVGTGPDHKIGADIPIQYQISFQNTTPDIVGTSTVYDTLSSFLDIASLIAGASSHDYTVDDLGNNILRFTFNNINLPPDGVGFVKFQVRPRADIPECTRIENWAEINFGQESVVTDTVFHTVNCGEFIVWVDTVAFCGNGGYYLGSYYTQDTSFTSTVSFSTITSSITTIINVYDGSPDETIEATICEGETYIINGQSFTTSGVYLIATVDANGCPYTITLNLTVIENEGVSGYTQGNLRGNTLPFLWGGTHCLRHLFARGEFRQSLQDKYPLTVYPNSSSVAETTICQGDTIIWEREMLFSDTMLTHNHTSIHGCDSTTQIHLVVAPHQQVTIVTAICEGELFYIGQNGYGDAGTYMDTLQTYQGCDSVITLNLSILPHSSSAIAAVICEGESYTVGNSTYTQSGTYTTVLPAANGLRQHCHAGTVGAG